MNVLLIDDQPNILSSLMAGIPWLEMGFSSIFTAQSANAAREILSDNKVDIVVSDIEMPGEDGISLLQWAREQGYDYECILLTAHADFTFAQKAISLGVLEYVIQPAKQQDIIHAIEHAIQKIKANGETSPVLLAADQFNYAAQNIVIKTLFEEWPVIEASIINPAKLEKRITQLKQFGINVEAENPCIITLINIRKWKKLPLTAADFLKHYNHLLHELFPTDTTTISYYLDDKYFITVFFTEGTDEIIRGIEALHERIPSDIGAATRLFFAKTEVRFIKNTMEGIIGIEKKDALTHKDDCRMIEVNNDDLYSEALGSDNYQHYNKLIHEYIENHISDAITRTDLADYLMIPPDHVSYIIKRTECCSVKELVTKIKMEHAKGLLQNTKYQISEIAFKCGYDSFAYFSKVYRETYGITPSQERS